MPGLLLVFKLCMIYKACVMYLKILHAQYPMVLFNWRSYLTFIFLGFFPITFFISCWNFFHCLYDFELGMRFYSSHMQRCGFSLEPSPSMSTEATFTPDGQYVVSGKVIHPFRFLYF